MALDLLSLTIGMVNSIQINTTGSSVQSGCRALLVSARFGFLALLCLTLSINLRAAQWFVDFGAGSDQKPGTGPDAAFQHCPGDENATGIAATTVLSAGDTIFFKGGVNYLFPGRIHLKWSGVAGKPIVYDGNSSGTWGVGRARFTDNHHLYPNGIGSTVFFSDVRRSHLVFKNLELAELGGSAELPKDTGVPIIRNLGIGFNFAAGCNNVSIADCVFQEIGYFWNKKPMEDCSISGLGIQTIGCNGLLITNCNFSRMNIGIEVSGDIVTNLVVAGCTFTDSMRWLIDLAPSSSSANFDSITIRGCTFYDYHQFDGANWTGYGDWPHTDGIFYRNTGSAALASFGTNVNIHGNTFYQTAPSAGGTAAIYITEGPSANIYNNKFIHSGKGHSIDLAGGPYSSTRDQVVNIFNNTFVEDYQPAVRVGDSGNPARPVKRLNVLNNIFYDARANNSNNRIISIQGVADNVALWRFDYNLYRSLNLAGSFYSWEEVEAGGLSTMRKRNWELNGFTADPRFSNLTFGIGSSCYMNDVRLQSDSPAIGVGVNLQSYFTSDFLGRSRPSSPTLWSLGAFEGRSTSGSGPVVPPQRIRILAQQY